MVWILYDMFTWQPFYLLILHPHIDMLAFTQLFIPFSPSLYILCISYPFLPREAFIPNTNWIFEHLHTFRRILCFVPIVRMICSKESSFLVARHSKIFQRFNVSLYVVERKDEEKQSSSSSPSSLFGLDLCLLDFGHDWVLALNS